MAFGPVPVRPAVVDWVTWVVERDEERSVSRKVVHFEIPVDEGGRAVSFYERVFGWRMERFGPQAYWTTEAGDGDGIGGALAQRDQTLPGVLVYIDVPDIHAALADVEAAGGRILRGPDPVPGVGWSATFEDTEGNPIGLFTPDAGALPSGGAGEA